MRLSVFVSYARKHAEHKDRVLATLAPLIRNGTLDVWHDAELLAGDEFNDEIRTRLETADLILLLISDPFLASTYCDLEMQLAMTRDDARVIPIIVNECDWQQQPFAKKYNVVKPGEDVLAHLRRAVAVMWRRVSNLPPRNADFTGREDLLASMTADTCVLVGMDGVGRAQLAIEYAHRHAEEYSILWRIAADDPAKLASDYAALADALELPERTLQDQREIVQAVKRYLAATPRWLLIFENAAEPRDLAPFLPGGDAGRTLVTTRNAAWRGAGVPLAVDVMTREDSVALLLRRSGSNDRAAAGELANELGDLPLALVQAAAYCHRNAKPLDKFVKLFRKERKALLEKRTTEEDTVAVTVGMMLDALRDEDQTAADLLPLCAFLAHEDIPTSLLGEELAVDDAVGSWREQSLVVATGDDAVTMHPVVQLVIRHRLTEEETARWTQTACAAVDRVFPVKPQDSREWPQARRLVPHVRTACRLAEEAGVDNAFAAPLLNRAGMYQRHRRESDDALELYTAAERWLLRFHGEDHPGVPVIRSNVATLLGEYGGTGRSIDVFRAALEQGRRIYGDRHHAVARDLGNVGTALIEADRPAEALPLLREAEALLESLGAEEHADAYAVTKTNLATALLRLGRAEEATREFEAALAIKEKLYGPDNAALLTTLTNLGVASGEERHLTRALSLAETHFGPEDPETYRIRIQLALHAARTGDLQAAAEFFNVLLDKLLEVFDGASVAPTLDEFADVVESGGAPTAAASYRALAAYLRGPQT